jgi:hypothetical protein
MKNQQPTITAAEYSYLRGWVIALQNYEVNEIESIKEKLTSPLILEYSSYNTTSSSKR